MDILKIRWLADMLMADYPAPDFLRYDIANRLLSKETNPANKASGRQLKALIGGPPS